MEKGKNNLLVTVGSVDGVGLARRGAVLVTPRARRGSGEPPGAFVPEAKGAR